MSVINYENLRSFAYSNDRLIAGTPKGIIIDFMGLGGAAMYDGETDSGRLYAAEGLIFVIPYNDPWCWMNRTAVRFTDAIVAVLIEKYKLADPLIISSGGSMGGLSALVYSRYAAVTPAACVANCPVCDLPYHYTERPDLPRTIYAAFSGYDCGLDEAIESASPLHLAAKMPDIPYYLFHCEEDKAVNKEMHSDRLFEALAKTHRVKYIEIPGRGHCDLGPEGWEKYRRAITEFF